MLVLIKLNIIPPQVTNIFQLFINISPFHAVKSECRHVRLSVRFYAIKYTYCFKMLSHIEPFSECHTHCLFIYVCKLKYKYIYNFFLLLLFVNCGNFSTGKPSFSIKPQLKEITCMYVLYSSSFSACVCVVTLLKIKYYTENTHLNVFIITRPQNETY